MPTKGFIFSLSFDKHVEKYKWKRLSNEITTNTMNDVCWFVYSIQVIVNNHVMLLGSIWLGVSITL